MAMETQKPKETDLQHDELTSETLETVQHKPSITSLQLSSAEDPVTEVPLMEDEGSKEIECPSSESPLGSSMDVPVSDLQKRMRRAERFGMSVQLSEEEKRNSRAERFGTAGSALPGSDESKKSEELKRKARAERFGLSAESLADDEGKKKARSARFAPVSKTDPVEEDKKKARAIRFSQGGSNAPSEVNGKANS